MLDFRRTSFPPDEISAGRDGIDTTDCNTVWGFPHMNSAAADCGAVDLIFRRTNFPPDDLSAGRDGDYIWRDMWTGLSVFNRSVTRSLPFGSSHRLGRCCLWLAGLPFCLIGSAEVPMRHHLLLAVSRRESHEVTLSNQLTGMHLLSGASMIWSYSWILHCVGTLYGQMVEVYLLIWTCVCMIRASVCFVSFLPLIQQFTGPRQLPPYFRLILTISYCLHEFLREQELETNISPDTDMT